MHIQLEVVLQLSITWVTFKHWDIKALCCWYLAFLFYSRLVPQKKK